MSARSCRLLTAAWACAVLVACQAKPDSAGKGEGASSPSEAGAHASPSGAEPTEPEPKPEPEPAPKPGELVGPGGDPDAALALLVGGEAASALPVVATDPGHAFDPALVQKLAPKADPFAKSTKVELGAVVVEGDLDRAIIRRIVRSHLAELRFCYDRALAAQPTLTARVEIDFRIGPDGRVRVASVGESSSEEASEVAACFAQRVRLWTFPQPEDGQPVELSHHFVLQPG